MKSEFSINEDKLDNVNNVLRALSHPLRLKIIDYIDKNKSVNVNRIYSELNLEQSITSQHLRILRMVNLVLTHREGKQVFYTVNYAYTRQVVQAIGQFQSEQQEA